MNGLCAAVEGSAYEDSTILADYNPVDMSQYNTMGEYYPPQDNIDTLNINWQGGRVEVIAYNEEDYYMEEGATRQLQEDERLSYSIDGNVFSIDFTSSEDITVGDAYKRVEVRVPRDIAENMKTININTNGEVVVRNITAQTIKINGREGDINCENVYAKDMDIDSQNGNVNLKVGSSVGYKLDYKTESGKMDSYFESEGNSYICGDKSYTYDIKTVSGNLEVDLSVVEYENVG